MLFLEAPEALRQPHTLVLEPQTLALEPYRGSKTTLDSFLELWTLTLVPSRGFKTALETDFGGP